MRAIQDTYPDDLSHCYGCGRNNPLGLHLKSYWQDGEAVAHITPQPHHVAVPGFVYGGMIASLIDCHATGTASAAAYAAEGRELGSPPHRRFVTANLNVDYLAPTPIGTELELRGHAIEVKPRKVVVEVTMSAQGKPCARGRAVLVLTPQSMGG
jgi:acyl-coenzyme A thioesterase PaaI-like protein